MSFARRGVASRRGHAITAVSPCAGTSTVCTMNLFRFGLDGTAVRSPSRRCRLFTSGLLFWGKTIRPPAQVALDQKTSSFFDHRDPEKVKWLGTRKL